LWIVHNRVGTDALVCPGEQSSACFAYHHPPPEQKFWQRLERPSDSIACRYSCIRQTLDVPKMTLFVGMDVQKF
jgi:hypothetical protein